MRLEPNTMYDPFINVRECFDFEIQPFINVRECFDFEIQPCASLVRRLKIKRKYAFSII